MRVMLLAAGRGERMRPLTDHTPKPLLQVGGKPLIVWHLQRLAQAGLHDVVINHAYLGQQIVDMLGDGNQYGVRIQYSAENPVLETAGGIANALPLLGEGEPFAVINSDIYCAYDFAQLPGQATAMVERNDLAHLVLVNNPPQHPAGDFGLNNGRVTLSLTPTLSQGERGNILTFSGIGIYMPQLFSPIARGKRAQLAPLLREQIALDKVSGEHYPGRWEDVGTPQRLQQLDKELSKQHNIHHV